MNSDNQRVSRTEMALPPRDPQSKNPFYCRKEKSLGVLCDKFLKLYNRDGVDSIGLDAAALQLGVERRRIYDIVNILESVGVLCRKAKNQYTWKGFGAIPLALKSLKEQGLQEKYGTRAANVPNDNGSRPASCSNATGSSKNSESRKAENRREKSLGLLSQSFLKLFLCSDEEFISLDSAASTLLGDSHDPTAMRTKIRRLYDIANVFASMKLIEKTRHYESGKPAFCWIGVDGTPKHGSSTAVDVKNLKRRVFGTEITNTVSKRYNSDSVFNQKSNEKVKMQIHPNSVISNYENSNIRTEQHQKQGAKGFVFGPFTPETVTTTGLPGNSNMQQIKDWENLASMYRPQYHNQELNDLFDHYAEAWKSWCDEATKEKQKSPLD